MTGTARSLPDSDALYETAPCGLLLTEIDGRLLRVNATFCSWIGMSAEELAGHRTLQSLLTVGSQLFHQTHWAPLLHMQGSVAEVKVDFVTRAGGRVPMLMNAARIDHDGRLVHEVALIVVADRHKYERALVEARKRADAALLGEQQARDDLRRAQARLELALESAHLLVWEASLTGVPDRTYGQGTSRLLGLDPAVPVDQGLVEAAMPPADREREAKAYAAALQDPVGRYACTYRLNGADGVQRIVSSTGRGEYGPAGQMLRIVGVLQDVTAVSQQRNAAEDRALLAEQMVGIVSHDLRNPLAVISMSHAALERSSPGDAQRTHLARIARSTSRSQRLISDLLDFTAARIGSGISVHLRPLDLPQLIQDAVDDLRSAYPQATLIAQGQGEGKCVADGDRIVQLLGNLVSNAIHYGERSRPITVTWEFDALEYRLSIHNHGPPIDSQVLPTLFQPMMQGGRTSSARVGTRSVGLGLFIVSEIARAHGGKVSIQSTPAAGTRVTARFPLTLSSAR